MKVGRRLMMIWNIMIMVGIPNSIDQGDIGDAIDTMDIILDNRNVANDAPEPLLSPQYHPLYHPE